MTLIKRVDLFEKETGEKVAIALTDHFNRLHSKDFYPMYEVEKELVDNQVKIVDLLSKKKVRAHEFVFSPSGASKCERELFYKAKGFKGIEDRLPYHRRWTRNASFVHAAVQRDLLYAERLVNDPKFTVHRLDNGDIAWEELLKTAKVVNHNGISFAISGMMDGILEYNNKLVGFEFKTKSTTIASVGDYMLRGIKDEHKLQCVAYSILFGMDEFLVMYESLAKDGWTKNENAKKDFKVFHYVVTEEDRENLLDKFGRVVTSIENNCLPQKEENKCLFCSYKHICEVEKC